MFEISGEEEVSVLEACMIEEDNMCEAYRVDDVAANKKMKEMFVYNTTRVEDDHGKPSSTLNSKTWALADVRPKTRKVAAEKQRL